MGGTRGPLRWLGSLGRRYTELTPGQPEAGGALAGRWDGLGKLSWEDGSLVVEGSALFVDERQRWRSGQLYSFADNRQSNAQVGARWSSGAHQLAPALSWTRCSTERMGLSFPSLVAP